jgi:calreticulin
MPRDFYVECATLCCPYSLTHNASQGWKERWTVPSDWKPASELGDWAHTAGEFNGGSSDDRGIQTSQDARFYGLSAPLEKPFASADKKDLVIQYSVKHEQKIDCGGAYIKLLPGGKGFDSAKFGGDTPYAGTYLHTA